MKEIVKTKKKCYICSGDHDHDKQCQADRFCFHCEGGHSPNSKICPRYSFEQDVFEIANTEYASISYAKRKLMGANKSPHSTYATVVKNIRSTFVNKYLATQSAKNGKKEKSNVQTSTSGQVPQSRSSTHQNININKSTQDKHIISGSLPNLVEMNKDDDDYIPMESSSTEMLLDAPKDPKNKKSSSSSSESISVTQKKQRVNNDGFVFPSKKKCGRPTVPINNDTPKIKNSFSALSKFPTVTKNTSPQERKNFQLPKPLSDRESNISLSAALENTRGTTQHKIKRLNKDSYSQHASQHRGSMPGKKS